MSIMYHDAKVAGIPEVDLALDKTSQNPIANSAVAATGIGVFGNTMTPIVDANAAVPTGFYSTNTSTVNLPSAVSGNALEGMITTVARGDYVYQQFVNYIGSRTYVRYRKNGVWADWVSTNPIVSKDVTISVPAGTWCTCPVKSLLDVYSSNIVAVEAWDPATASSSNFVLWKTQGWNNITFLRINTNSTNLSIVNTADDAVKLRIWYKP